VTRPLAHMMGERRVEDRGLPRLLLPVGGLFVLATLVALAAVYRSTWAEWAALDVSSDAFSWNARPGWLAVAVATGGGALLLTGALWVALFRAAGGRIGTREGVAAWLGSNLGRYLPGKVWQLTSIAAYVRARGEPGSAAVVVSLALQAVTLTTGTVVALALVGEAAFYRANPWTLAAGGVVVLLVLSPGFLRLLIRFGRRLLGETDERQIRELSPGALMRSGLIGVIIWGLYGIGFWSVLEGLLDPNPVSLAAATGVFAAGYVAGYIVLLAPGGVVVREGTIAALLGVVSGIPLGPAAALALAARAWTTAAELLAFAIALALGLRRGPVDQ